MNPGSRRIPDALLERYLAEALDTEAKAHLEKLLSESSADQARLEALRADSAAFLLRHPPEAVAARLESSQKRPAWFRWPMLLVPVLAAAVVLLVVGLPDDPYTIKGSVVLVLHRKVGQGSAPVSPDVPLVPGDAIRFEVKAPASGFVAVLGRDARGTITVYYPYGGTKPTAFDASQPLLPGAISLDDTLGREDVYVLHSAHAFELGWAVKALEEGRALDQAAPRDVSVGHASFTKQAAP